MAVDSSIDLELQLKKRARRRLVGAIALVLLMVIVLPMVLRDRSSDQPKQEVTITIPNEVINSAVSSQKVITAPSHTVEQASSKPAVDDVAVNNETKQTVIVDADSNQAAKPATKLLDEKIEDKKQAATVKATEPESPAISNNMKFYVQIGVFSDAENVKKLQAKLSELGYKSQTEKISTDKGEKIRLRTSTFKEHNEAAIALENIKSSGMAGMVVSQK